MSAVNGGGMSVIVGIVIVALITWVVVTFGIKWFYKFEQYVHSFHFLRTSDEERFC